MLLHSRQGTVRHAAAQQADWGGADWLPLRGHCPAWKHAHDEQVQMLLLKAPQQATRAAFRADIQGESQRVCNPDRCGTPVHSTRCHSAGSASGLLSRHAASGMPSL